MEQEPGAELARRVSGSQRQSFVRCSGAEMREELRCLSRFFELVRLVDPLRACELRLDARGAIGEVPCLPEDHLCSQGARLSGVVMRAFHERNQLAKFEFIDDEFYYIDLRYVEVEGRGCMLELVSRVAENAVIEGFGRHEFMDAILHHNERMYKDPLTGVYNRRYYEDHFQHLHTLCGVAMIDVDGFKQVNDNYGHAMGDCVLRAIADAIRSCVRETDAVIRYGGDEFVIVFDGIPAELMQVRIDNIRAKVDALRFPQQPGLRAAVSVGGAHGDASVAALVEEADHAMYRVKGKR